MCETCKIRRCDFIFHYYIFTQVDRRYICTWWFDIARSTDQCRYLLQCCLLHWSYFENNFFWIYRRRQHLFIRVMVINWLPYSLCITDWHVFLRYNLSGGFSNKGKEILSNLLCVFVILFLICFLGVNISFLKILRLLRTLRPLRFVSHNVNLKVVVIALFESVSGIFNVLIVILLIW